MVDDIDLAVNLNPDEVLKIFKKNYIKFYEIGINHGTITALIDNKKFEIYMLSGFLDFPNNIKDCYKKNYKELKKKASLKQKLLALQNVDVISSWKNF